MPPDFDDSCASPSAMMNSDGRDDMSVQFSAFVTEESSSTTMVPLNHDDQLDQAQTSPILPSRTSSSGETFFYAELDDFSVPHPQANLHRGVEDLTMAQATYPEETHSTSPVESRDAVAVAREWIFRLDSGESVPSPQILIGLLSAMLSAVQQPTPTAAAANVGDVKLVQGVPIIGPGSKFPHVVTECGQWEQCATKMTHIVVSLQNSSGEPVKGSTVEPGGLELELTLLDVSGNKLATEQNMRNGKPLMSGSAHGPFETKVKMTENSHTFRFFIKILSSQIGKKPLRVQVKPVRPDLSAIESLTVTSKEFISRARDPGECKVTGKRSHEQVTLYRSLAAFSTDEEEGEAEEDEADTVMIDSDAATKRIQDPTARAKIREMLDALESQQEMPSRPVLLETLRLCCIGA